MVEEAAAEDEVEVEVELEVLDEEELEVDEEVELLDEVEFEVELFDEVEFEVELFDVDLFVAALLAAPATVPVETTFPWLSITATLENLVLIPKTALKASAWAPVLTVAALAAVRAFWQVSLAVWSALQELVRVSQMN